jgi:ribosomal subunit interface protein
MEISITVRHGSVPDDLKDRGRELVEKLAKRANRPQSADIVLDQQHDKCIAELKLHLPGGQLVVASAEEHDFRSALDRMFDKAVAQLAKTAVKH